MSKWTWPALAAIVAIASGGYYLFSKRQDRPRVHDAADLDVEAFGDDSDSEDGDNTYEMLDEAGAGGAAKTATSAKAPDEDIKTIDDDDDIGETVKDPVVIDDEENGAVEPVKPDQPQK